MSFHAPPSSLTKKTAQVSQGDLLLPEIVALIGAELTKRDLAKCIQVCRAWSIEFIPLLWNKILVLVQTASLVRLPARVLPGVPFSSELLTPLQGTVVGGQGISRSPQQLTQPRPVVDERKVDVGAILSKSGCYIRHLYIIDSSEMDSSESPHEPQKVGSENDSYVEKSNPELSGLPSRRHRRGFDAFNCEALCGLNSLHALTLSKSLTTLWKILGRNRATLQVFIATALYPPGTQLAKERKQDPGQWVFFPLGSLLPEYGSPFPGFAPAEDLCFSALRTLQLNSWALTKTQFEAVLKSTPVLKDLSLSDLWLKDDTKNLDSPMASSALLRPTLTTLAPGSPAHEALYALGGTGTAEDNQRPTSSPTTPTGTKTASYQHHGLERLRLCGKLYLVVDHFPNLRKLEFFRFDRPVSPTSDLDAFCQSIRTCCPKLSELNAYGFESSMLPPVIESLAQLKVYRGCNDIHTVLAMLSHTDTLEEVNLSDYSKNTFWPLKLLETCPRLVKFTAGFSMTTMEDVQKSIWSQPLAAGTGSILDMDADQSVEHGGYGHGPGGWACRGLRELRLSIMRLNTPVIEAVMSDLNATRVQVTKPYVKESLQAASATLSPSWTLLPLEKRFRKDFGEFLRGLEELGMLNLGTGWYRIPRPQ